MFRLVRSLPFFKILAIAQIALLARRHVQRLDPAERRRMITLARGGRRLTPGDRSELRRLVAKLEPGAFAGGAARHFMPFALPGRFGGGRR